MDELQFGPIPWDDVSEAKFGFDSEKGRVLVDAGIATKLIETSPDKFSPWLHNSLAFNDVATTELNIYEHLWSRRTVQASSTYDQVQEILGDKKVQVIPVAINKVNAMCTPLLRTKLRHLGKSSINPLEKERNMKVDDGRHQGRRSAHISLNLLLKYK